MRLLVHPWKLLPLFWQRYFLCSLNLFNGCPLVKDILVPVSPWNRENIQGINSLFIFLQILSSCQNIFLNFIPSIYSLFNVLPPSVTEELYPDTFYRYVNFFTFIPVKFSTLYFTVSIIFSYSSNGNTVFHYYKQVYDYILALSVHFDTLERLSRPNNSTIPSVARFDAIPTIHNIL